MTFKYKKRFKPETVDKLIIETMEDKKTNIRNVKDLVKHLQRKYNIPKKTTLERVEELELNGKISLRSATAEPKEPIPEDILEFLQSHYGLEFWIVCLLTLVTIPAVLFLQDPPLVYIRWVLAIIFVLFIPGYALTSALFPTSEEIDEIERITLSFGLSIAVAVFTGLALNFTFGIQLLPLVVSLSGFTFVVMLIVLLRKTNKLEKIPEVIRKFLSGRKPPESKEK